MFEFKIEDYGNNYKAQAIATELMFGVMYISSGLYFRQILGTVQ